MQPSKQLALFRSRLLLLGHFCDVILDMLDGRCLFDGFRKQREVHTEERWLNHVLGKQH